MMDYLSQTNNKSVIANEYDYSNIVPGAESIAYLVDCCQNIYEDILKKSEDEEEKNKPYKPEYKEYMYKTSYNFRW